MPQYRVRPGFRHGVGKKYGPGDTVTLTVQEAAGFLDKLVLVAEAEETAPVPLVQENSVGTPDISVETPDISEPTLHFWTEPVTTVTLTTATSPGTTGTVISADTPVTLTENVSANFSDVVGIGQAAQAALNAAGYLTWEDVLQAGILKIGEDVPSISPSRVRALFTRAQREAA